MISDNKQPYKFTNRIIAHILMDDVYKGYSCLIHLLAKLLVKQDMYRDRVYGHGAMLDYVERVVDKEGTYGIKSDS